MRLTIGIKLINLAHRVVVTMDRVVSMTICVSILLQKFIIILISKFAMLMLDSEYG